MNKKLFVMVFLVVFSTIITACGGNSISTSGPNADNGIVDNTSGNESRTSGSDTYDNQNTDESENTELLSQFEEMFKNPHPAYDENDNGGYIDINGNWVIEPQYRRVYSFSEGLAAVQDAVTEKWGYINLNGDIVIEPRFYSAYAFKDGRAIISLDRELDDFGMIDATGNFVIEPVYRTVYYFKDGYTLVQEKDSNMYRYMNENYQFVFDEYNEAYLFNNGSAVVNYYGKWCKLDEKGQLSDFSVDISEFRSSDFYGDPHNYKTGSYIDLSRGEVVKTTSEQYVIIDEAGNAISPYFDNVSRFSGDYARASKIIDGKWYYGFIDKNYDWFIEPHYKELGNLINGYAFAVKEDIDFLNSDVQYNMEHMYDSFVLIDKDDNVILDGADHNGVRLRVTSFSGLLKGTPIAARKKMSDKQGDYGYGYVDWNYNEIIPFKFERTGNFSNDGSYALVKYNGYWGIIDKDGKWLIEAKFSNLSENRNVGDYSNYDGFYLENDLDWYIDDYY